MTHFDRNKELKCDFQYSDKTNDWSEAYNLVKPLMDS